MYTRFIQLFPRGQIAKNTILSLCWQGTRIILLSAWIILAARIMEAQDYGTYAGIAALAVIFGSVTGLGFNQVLFQDTIRNVTLFNKLWSTTLAITICSGIVFLLLFLMCSHFLFTKIYTSTLLAIGLTELLCAPIITAATFAFSSQYKIGWSSGLPSIMALMRLLGLICFFYIHEKKSVNDFVWFNLAATFIASCIALFSVTIFLKPKLLPITLKFGDLTTGLPFCASLATLNGLGSLDKSLVLKISGTEMAGLYNAAYRLASIFTQPMEALINAASPKLFLNDNKKNQQLIQKLLLAFLTYGSCAGIGLWILSGYITSILGPSFAGISDVMQWFSLFVVCYGFRILGTNILITSNRVRLKVLIELGGLCILICSGLWLLPQYGLKGAVSMIVITETFVASACIISILKIQKKQ